MTVESPLPASVNSDTPNIATTVSASVAATMMPCLMLSLQQAIATMKRTRLLPAPTYFAVTASPSANPK